MQRDAVGVVHQSVQDRVSNGRVLKDAMPAGDRKLSGDQDGTVSISVIHNFQQVAAMERFQRRESKVVENEHIRLFQGGQQLGPGSVISGCQQVAEQPVYAQALDFQSFSARGIAKGGGQPGFAGTARAGYEQVSPCYYIFAP